MNKIVRAQYYANEVCNSCATIAAFVASFIAVVIGVSESTTSVFAAAKQSNSAAFLLVPKLTAETKQTGI